MKPPESAASVEFEVPFHDVDGLRVVWHGHYAKYFELARTRLLRDYQLDVPQMIATGCGMVVFDYRCRMNFPLRYAERCRVSAWFVAHERWLRIAYRAQNLTHDRCSAKGHTLLAFTDADGALLTEIPDAIRARLPV